MNTNDITAKQFETLVIIKLLDEYSGIDSEYDTISKVADGIFEGSIKLTGSPIDRDDFIENVCALTKHGYIVSDMDELDDMLDEIPDIEGITLKGQTVLAEFESSAKEAIKSDKKFVLFENLNINISFLGGIDAGVSLFKDAGGLYTFVASKLFKK